MLLLQLLHQITSSITWNDLRFYRYSSIRKFTWQPFPWSAYLFNISNYCRNLLHVHEPVQIWKLFILLNIWNKFHWFYVLALFLQIALTNPATQFNYYYVIRHIPYLRKFPKCWPKAGSKSYNNTTTWFTLGVKKSGRLIVKYLTPKPDQNCKN